VQVPHIGVLLEQTLGHVTHGRNLEHTFRQVDDAWFECRELPFEPEAALDRFPPYSNWTVRSSLAARSAVKAMEAVAPLDALFVHTHVPASLLLRHMKRVPTVVSIDATPAQIDSLGGSYNHDVHPGVVEKAKRLIHTQCFQRATGLVTWSRWAADSLVDDYGVDRGAIEVIPPGVVASQWRRPGTRRVDGDTVRILFVGGDFERKGGGLLVEAVERLRHELSSTGAATSVEAHLVTSASVSPRPGIHVHNGLTPNSPELIELFHRCDIFALPTFGDCTPLVLAEASTAGLPVVSTDVGAISESVIDGVTGNLVDTSVESLVDGLRPLVTCPEHRLALGEKAAEHAARTMDSQKNARKLIELVLDVAQRRSLHPRVLLTVSGNISPEAEDAIEAGTRPLADYVAIARTTNADLLDWELLRRDGSAVTNLIRRLAGNSVAMGYHLWRTQGDYDVIISDGEQVGLPFAALARWGGARQVRHLMIAHRLSPTKKALTISLLGLSREVDEVLVYCSRQQTVAERLFDSADCQVRLIDFMVDTEFFRPTRKPFARCDRARPLLCAAGREFRDYPVLIDAVRGLDVDLVIASASPWSRRSDNARSVDLPDNVTVTALTQRGLRDLLNEADALVLPLQPTDFQAGITTILEAMSMGRPIICTSTEGQTDVIEEGLHGLYVPPGDVDAIRRAILRLTGDPDTALAMGERGRQLAEERAEVRSYAAMFAERVRFHALGDSHVDPVPLPLDAAKRGAPDNPAFRVAPLAGGADRSAVG
jgi:glycosyltransferase involved in cell wall biosynthesis